MRGGVLSDALVALFLSAIALIALVQGIGSSSISISSVDRKIDAIFSSDSSYLLSPSGQPVDTLPANED
jgi:hypothetical protein